MKLLWLAHILMNSGLCLLHDKFTISKDFGGW